jgi:hypothetical protein
LATTLRHQTFCGFARFFQSSLSSPSFLSGSSTPLPDCPRLDLPLLFLLCKHVCLCHICMRAFRPRLRGEIHNAAGDLSSQQDPLLPRDEAHLMPVGFVPRSLQIPCNRISFSFCAYSISKFCCFSFSLTSFSSGISFPPFHCSFFLTERGVRSTFPFLCLCYFNLPSSSSTTSLLLIIFFDFGAAARGNVPYCPMEAFFFASTIPRWECLGVRD